VQEAPRPAAPRTANAEADEKPAPSARRVPDALKFANGLLRERKYDLAAEEYERYLTAGASGLDRDDARFGLANARLYQARYAEARQAFDDFLKGAGPGDSRLLSARYRLGELSYLLGELAAARRALEAFTAATADHRGLELAWTYLGDTCFGLHDFAQARIAYERSLADFPKGRLVERARYGLGRTLAELGEPERGLSVLRELATRGSPEWVDRAWLQIGLIELARGQFAAAAAALAALEQAAPRSALKSEAQLHRALALARLGRVDQAETVLRTLAKSEAEPLGPRAALELATIELEHNRPEAALTEIDAALERYPKSSAAAALHFRAAESLQKQSRRELAEARYIRVVEIDPADPWADLAMQRAAQSALDRGDAARARQLAGAFLTRFPRSPRRAETRLVAARAAALAGDSHEAVTILERLLDPAAANGKGSEALGPPLAQAARYDLALAYRALGRKSQAEAILAKLARESAGPLSADAQFLLGQAHLDAGRYAAAIAPLEQYLAANPNGDVADFAMAHLAMARLGLGKLDDAWTILARLSERFPRSKALAPTRLRLAETALAAGRADKAAEQFRLVAGGETAPSEPAPAGTAKRADSGSPALRVRALAGLGRALWELGEPKEAASAFAAVLDLAPGDPTAPEIALAQGRCLEASQQADAAVNVYSSILQRFAKSEQAPQAALARARVWVKMGRSEQGARELERLSGDEGARVALASAGATADALLAEAGWAFLDAEKPAEADRVFTRLLAEFPNGPFAADARCNLAESANMKRNYAEVVRLLGPLAATKTPAQRDTRSGASGEAIQSGTADRAATESLRRLIPTVLYRLGRTQVELKDWAAARAVLDRLVSEYPSNPYHREARCLLSESALQQGDAAAALAGFDALLKEPAGASDPKGFAQLVRLKQIQCLVALKRWKQVLECVTTENAGLAPGDPARAELDFASGQALLGLGRMGAARGAFQSVVDARAGSDLGAQARLMHGEAFYHEDKFHEALRDFLNVDIMYNAPHWQAAALLEAGKVYERLDQWADAAETYEMLLTKFPKEPSAAEARVRRETARRHTAATSSARKS
jgi:TolA-binding protein